MHLSVDVVSSPPQALVRLGGELDIASSAMLRSAVGRLLEGPCSELVLDLDAVTFMDCTGVSTLLGCVEDAHLHGAHLHLRPVSPQVARLLALTGTAARLTLAEPVA